MDILLIPQLGAVVEGNPTTLDGHPAMLYVVHLRLSGILCPNDPDSFQAAGSYRGQSNGTGETVRCSSDLYIVLRNDLI